MNYPTRPPAFLSGRNAKSAVRQASFTPAPGGAPRPPAGIRPSSIFDEPPPGPTAEQLAEFRAEALQKVQHAVEVLRLQSERLAEQARADAMEIGFAVARRIIEAELATSPEAFFSLVKGALKKAGESRKIVVRVHPDDVRGVAAAAEVGQLGIQSAALEVVADHGLERGDCMVDTDFGKVDGRLRTRIEELHRAADGMLEEGAA